VAEAFKRAIQYKDSYNPEKQEMQAWISVIVSNTYHDYIADLFKRGLSVPVNDVNLGTYERDFEGFATVEQLMKEIAKLEDGMTKDCLSMYFVLGMTPKEISMVSPANSKFVRNAVYRFKAVIADRFGVGGEFAD
jgi:DNA-directed RNA polymerase specialized sigma24 family protein